MATSDLQVLQRRGAEELLCPCSGENKLEIKPTGSGSMSGPQDAAMHLLDVTLSEGAHSPGVLVLAVYSRANSAGWSSQHRSLAGPPGPASRCSFAGAPAQGFS